MLDTGPLNSFLKKKKVLISETYMIDLFHQSPFSLLPIILTKHWKMWME